MNHTLRSGGDDDGDNDGGGGMDGAVDVPRDRAWRALV